MDKLFTWEFWKAAFARALWTMAQTALSMITIGATIAEINWIQIASVAAVAGVYSILKSIVVSMPEVKNANPELVEIDLGEKLLHETMTAAEEADSSDEENPEQK